MVANLNTSGNRVLQERLMATIVSILIRQVPKDQELEMLEEWGSRWNSPAEGTELERRYKMEESNAWWEKHRAEYYCWWKFWTGAASR